MLSSVFSSIIRIPLCFINAGTIGCRSALAITLGRRQRSDTLGANSNTCSRTLPPISVKLPRGVQPVSTARCSGITCRRRPVRSRRVSTGTLAAIFSRCDSCCSRSRRFYDVTATEAPGQSPEPVWLAWGSTEHGGRQSRPCRQPIGR